MPSRSIRTAEVNRKVRTYIAVGVVSLLILLVTLITAGRQLSLRCERLASGDVDCRVRQSILGVITLSEKAIPGAKAISIGQQCEDVVCNYRLEVYATQGLVPVVDQYTSNYEQQQRLKDQLNDFFIDTTRSFVQMKQETNPILIVAVFAVAIILWAYLGYLIWQTQNIEQPG